MPAPREITPAQLLRLIGTPGAPALIDCRIPDDLTDDPRLIPGASLVDFGTQTPPPAAAIAQSIVIYCQRGAKLSQGLAAIWRAQGYDVEVLAGGHVAWVDQELPTVTLPAPAPTRWVTRQRPKIDRIACPWLIRRFVDPGAEFLFVPAAHVPLVSEKFDAVAFDRPEDHDDPAAWSHRGTDCTFDTMLKGFGLDFPPLNRMATVVRGADTNQHDLAPEAAGLLALSVGLSRQYRDDNAQLEAGMALYDALFRWARDGVNEGHDWEPKS